MPLINPDDFHVATIECTQCDEKIVNPSEADRFEFQAAHIHGNDLLRALFEKKARILREAESR